MKLTLVRNATLLLEIGNQRILVDPMLGAKGSLNPFATTSGDMSRNPTVDLGVPLSELLDPDLVVVTHTHVDHWDPAAAALLPRTVPLLVQGDADAEKVSANGFIDVRVMDTEIEVGGTTVCRTDGQHGSDEVLQSLPVLGPVSGVVLRHPGEPVIYIAGDSVWNDAVRDALRKHEPDVVVLNTGEATLLAEAHIILMGAQDVVRAHRAAPHSHIVAVHMEALNHCVVSRDRVRDLVRENGLQGQVSVPEDGELLVF
ncbi:beta-lactamase domain-containing protein [Rhodococcus opacus M213]|uniref:Beta-lactamase domain-containing protein n=1 Tax=Rhodococcus opacus M213 TaxID=1129896 RepID=K8X5X9_RHOOP|nr:MULTISPECIES: MBL fold metallo-hydrolase [Rhodococcus]EKT76939.1 beta-lactamase domain-containing protein [Rhodococcus opacus M213]GLK40496.1 hypothetical protein GCM10017611_73710 [Rhodococcus wratislaviensis]